nr:reverse transcriptase domain-containing protein [Tanacetum cinerariifolium]
MHTRSKFYPNNSNATIPRRSNRIRVQNIVEPEIRTIEEVVPMVDCIMEELLKAPTEGYGEAIVILEILVENLKIKTNFLQLVQTNKFHGLERDNPHTHISNFKRMTSTLKYRDVLNDAIKLMLFLYSLEGAARIWYEKEHPNSILTWNDLVNKFVNQFFPPSKTTHLKNEISRFTQRFEETFREVWERFKKMLRACPHHGFSKLTQIDTFYNGLNEQDQDSLNAAAGGNLLSKMTRDALKIIENKSKVRSSRSKSNVSRVNTNSRDNASKTDDRIDKVADQILNLVEIVNKQVITPPTAKAVEKTYVICRGAHAYYDCIATDSNQPSVCTATGTCNQVSLSNRASHQIPPPGFALVQNNPNRFNQNQGQGKIFNQGNNFQNNQGYRAPMNNAPNLQNHGFQNQHFQVPNNQIQPGIPNELSSYMKSNEIMIKSMQNQINVLRGDFNKQEEKLRRNLNNGMRSILGSFFQNQASTSGTLLSNNVPNPKREMKAVTTRSGLAYEGSSIPTNSPLDKIPEKLRDLGKFLIPCDFPGINVCHALADLGASINLMPLSIWKKLSLSELTPTQMTLEVADRSITHLKRVVEDVFVKVGKFHFPTDFVVVDFEANPRVPLILERSFLRTGRALIDVYRQEITLMVNDESVTFNLNQTMRYSSTYDDNSVNRVDVIDIACEEFFQDSELSKEPIVKSSLPTLTPFGESDFFLEEIEDFLKDESIPIGIKNSLYDPEGDILYLEKLLNEDPFQLPPMDLKQAEETKAKSSIEEPHELELKELPSHLEFAFLEDTNKLPGIDLRFCTHKILMEEDYKPAVQSQRQTMEVLMYDFLVFGDSFSSCLSNLDKMLKCYEDTNLVLNWEKCHCMCKERIVLGHKILMSGIKVDRAKVDVKAKLPHPTTVKGVRSFLGHETPFVFSKDFIDAFNTLKKKLTEAPILVVPDRNLPFELMCDASDFAIGAKEMLALVYAFEKFRPYLVLSKSIVYTDHSALKYLLNKQDAKSRFLWWVLLLQEFDITIRDKKGYENLVADHLSRLKNPHKDVLENNDINENFPLETLGSLSSDSTTWENRASWSDKLDDVLWTFRTAFKTPIGCTLYKLVYEKSCHLTIELDHKVYWALKHVNFDLKTTGDHRKLQLNELNELRDQAYENSLIFKERTQKLYDSKIKNRIFNIGDQVLLFNTYLKISQGSGKLVGQALSPSPRFFRMVL